MQCHRHAVCMLHVALSVDADSTRCVQANVDVCCDPPDNGFGCDYTGLPGGRFNETSGALADVIPFTHVGGWPGDPTWMVVGAVVPWEVAVKTGDVAFAMEHYATAKALVDFMTRHVDPLLGLVRARCTVTLQRCDAARCVDVCCLACR
eukprot:m.1179159 g.1179159  ORF g.1179159 m.1179159 type:complete len:149 (+) comp24529_c0_seq22:2974-3420(+)